MQTNQSRVYNHQLGPYLTFTHPYLTYTLQAYIIPTLNHPKTRYQETRNRLYSQSLKELIKLSNPHLFTLPSPAFPKETTIKAIISNLPWAPVFCLLATLVSFPVTLCVVCGDPKTHSSFPF